MSFFTDKVLTSAKIISDYPNVFRFDINYFLGNKALKGNFYVFDEYFS